MLWGDPEQKERLWYFCTAIHILWIRVTYRLEVVCIVYFFGHEIVHICRQLILEMKTDENKTPRRCGPFVFDTCTAFANQREKTRSRGGNDEGFALVGDSLYRSPSDWLPPPSPLSGTRTWCQAALCLGGWRTWTTAGTYVGKTKLQRWMVHIFHISDQ